jgi:hypothetical protein
MTADKMSDAPQAQSPRLSRLWLVVYAIIFAFVALLAVETALRIRFPYDLYFWPESPFLTNLMKLDHHQPVYTNPADGNSFVYSPGLEYLCFAILKPFGLELDIRFCRLVSVALGLLASGFGALAVNRLVRSCVSVARPRLFFFATWGLIWLVLSKNFLADIDHPDNLHAFHATFIFWLSFLALETRRFGVAVLTMLVAGVGVFTKQTESLSVAGPALVFAIYNPWGWRRWLLLAAVGAVMLAISVHLLWLPPYAKFWTLDLLRHQKIWPTRSYLMLNDILYMDRGVLLCLTFFALPCIWALRNAARRYFICWLCIGFFTVSPNVLAYLKTMGIWNNLIIFQIWMIMLVWPFFAILTDSVPAARPAPGEATTPVWNSPLLPAAICALTLFFLLLLLPMKVPPRPGDYAFARQLEDAVRADLHAGRKVLLSHSTEILIRAGVTDPPFDRCNSVLEMFAGKLDDKSDIKSRLDAHYYDRIYLVAGAWYESNVLAVLNRNYMTNYVIPRSPYKSRLIYGYGELMEDCPVLSPRPKQ